MLTVIKSTGKIWFTDNVVVHMIKRTGISIRLGSRGYLLAVLRRDVMVGSRGLGRSECRLDTGSTVDLCC